VLQMRGLLSDLYIYETIRRNVSSQTNTTYRHVVVLCARGHPVRVATLLAPQLDPVVRLKAPQNTACIALKD
jgi:hypothetical protein